VDPSARLEVRTPRIGMWVVRSGPCKYAALYGPVRYIVEHSVAFSIESGNWMISAIQIRRRVRV
jgi:hypothetical protein